MRITRIDCQLLKVPLSRPRASLNEAAAGRLNHVHVLLVHIDMDAGLTGLGFAYALQSSGRALLRRRRGRHYPAVTGRRPPATTNGSACKVYWRLADGRPPRAGAAGVLGVRRGPVGPEGEGGRPAAVQAAGRCPRVGRRCTAPTPAWLWMSPDADHRRLAAVPRPGHDGHQGQGRRRPGGRRRPADRLARGVGRRRLAGGGCQRALRLRHGPGDGPVLRGGDRRRLVRGADHLRGRGGPRPAGVEAGHSDRGRRDAVRPRRVRRLPQTAAPWPWCSRT